MNCITDNSIFKKFLNIPYKHSCFFHISRSIFARSTTLTYDEHF